MNHVYLGWMRHRRHAPVAHAFGYPHGMVGLDLDDGRAFESHPWCGLARPAPLRFHRGDHLRPLDRPLREAVRDLVRRETGTAIDGGIELVTLPRCLGHCFNPVSFHLCHRADGSLAAIVSEITNTPWLERHAYVHAVPADHPSGAPIDVAFAKRFHISPFNGMRQEHRWRFIVRPDAFAVHMRNLEDGRTVFDATMVLRRRAMTAGGMARLLRTTPLLGLQALFRIYLHAGRLWRKRATVHPHPATLATA